MKQRGKSEKKTPDAPDAGEKYVLRLFVAGDESNSRQAKKNLAELCSSHLNGRCEIEIVDVLADFKAALKERVVVTPTLVLAAPPPRVTVLGTLSDTEKVLAALRLKEGD
jgi:circadian clock protein KaiB